MDVAFNTTKRYNFDAFFEISMKFKPVAAKAGSAAHSWPELDPNDNDPILPGRYQFVGRAPVEPEEIYTQMMADSIFEHVGRLSTLGAAVPGSYGEAKNSAKWHLWRLACNAELAALRDTQSYDIVPRLPRMDVLGSKWDFSIADDGTFRAKMVAVTRRRDRGTPCEITSSAVPRLDYMRFLLAVAAKNRFSVTHLKFNAAHLNIQLDDAMYMEPPPGFIVGGKKVSGSVLKLKKTVEGLARATYGRDIVLLGALEELGFYCAGNTRCFYHKGTGQDAVFVTMSEEDLLISARDPEKIKQVKSKLVAKFRMRDLGSPKKIRGMNVECNEQHTKIHLADYIDSLLKEYQMEDCTPRKTPYPPKEVETIPSIGNPRIPAYRPLLAKLLFAALTVRFDIASVVRYLCRYSECPLQKHWDAALDVVRYLKGSKYQGLTYDANAKHGGIFCFTGGELAEARDGEFSAHITTYAGSPILWTCTFSVELQYERGFELYFDSDDEEPEADLFNAAQPVFGATNGSTRSHHSAWKGGFLHGIWCVQTIYDVGLPVFFNMYSAREDIVRSMKKSLRYCEPKDRNEAGQYLVYDGLTDGQYLAGFDLRTCTCTEGINPVQILTRKLCYEDHKKFLRVLSPPPFPTESQNSFRISLDGRIFTGGN